MQIDKFFRMMIMASGRRQRPQSKLLSGSWSFSTTGASKRTYATAALLWSVPFQLPQSTRTTTAWTPPHRNSSTFLQTFPTTDTLLYGLGSPFEGEMSAGEGGDRRNQLSTHLIWHHCREPIGSTQDVARRLLHEQHPMEKALAVFADIQLEGRGTQGRRWERGDMSFGDVQNDGNLYLTVCIPQNQIPIAITLLPLQVGVFVAERILRLIGFCRQKDAWNDNANSEMPRTPHVTLKWPNDVLVNDQKISGTLIEFESVKYESIGSADASITWMLIGIGINVASAPSNLSKMPRPGKHIRRACCVEDFCSTSVAARNASVLPEHTAVILAQDLSSAIANWVFGGKDRMKSQWQREEALLQQWNSYAEWGVQYELRGRVVKEEDGGYEGEKVTTIGIERDGQLRVRGADGRERLLVAEYLF